jgi:predicted metal-dependent hydrolase
MTLQESTHDRVKTKLENWYRQQARQLFAERLAVYGQTAHWIGEEPPPMRLRRMKRTWGSCSSKGVITLNPHLVKSPPECIDYVIAHEVCHLREHNHGKDFYALQEQLFPGWRAAKTHLQTRGHIYLHF